MTQTRRPAAIRGVVASLIIAVSLAAPVLTHGALAMIR